jgi:hypothetical protein
MMKIAPALTLIGFGLLTAAPADVDGWAQVKWGMTVAEARAALGPMAATESQTPSPLTGEIFIRDIVIIRGIKMQGVVKASKESKLVNAVEIEVANLHELPQNRATFFSEIKQLLIEKYGSPTNESKDSVADDIETIAAWSFPSTRISLRWSESSQRYKLGFVVLTYSAIDKKALNVL